MLTIEEVAGMAKEQIPDRAGALTPEDISFLVGLLEEKDDILRYHALLLLQNRSELFSDVYPFWDILVEKFKSTNSYHRSIGLMLIADNVRWDTTCKFDPILEDFLAMVDDEKPVTVRQCVQSLCKIVPYKSHLIPRITEKLMSVDLSSRKETQQKILLLDILSVLAVTRRYVEDGKVETYIMNALTGALLDKKAKAGIEKLMKD
ncbi:hypothetical protein hrd7_17190 [Leptolinea sp. HRD-7]|nr:hypothetical protein hrd7_17190 [Leptolinea sp. HRD-7]